MELTIKSHFDAAHRLYGYKGKCGEIHGHTWNVDIVVVSRGPAKLDDNTCIWIDFKILKTALNEVCDMFDHKLLLRNDDPLVGQLKDVVCIVALDGVNPTAEILSRIIGLNFLRKLKEMLPDELVSNIDYVKVTVWESPIAGCTQIVENRL